MGNWKSKSGVALLVYDIVQALFDVAGAIDFVVERSKDLGWVGVVIEHVLDPAPGVVFGTLALGIFLLWWSQRRRPAPVEGTSVSTPQGTQTANVDAWRKVDPLYVWQAGCLWGGIAPQYPVTFFNPAYPDFSMLLRAVEHGEINAVKKVPKSKLASAQISRSELKRFATLRNESPAFLQDMPIPPKLMNPPKRGLYWAGAAGAVLAVVIIWNVIDYRQQLACVPKFEWLGEMQTIESHPQLNRPAVVRSARVTPISQASFFMTVEARGKGLDALYIFHQGVARDPSPTMWQLKPSGIAARALNPFSAIEVTAFATLPHQITFSEPQFSCAR